MKSIMIRLASLTFLLVSMTFGGTPALAQEAIGLILSASGTVTAQDQSGNSRQLTRRSPVYEGDTISTAARSRAQIRFNDNGLLALQPETSFIIEQHQFQGQEDGTESATYRLVRGGLQSITGLIGNTNKENYRVETPVATIGLRGTHWAATMCTSECAGNPPGLYGGVADGGIDVCNGGGCAAVETDSYFYAPDANTQPQLLLAPPSVVFSDSATSDEEEEAAEEADEGEAGADEGDDSSDETEVAETETQTSAPDDTSSFVASRANDVDPGSDLAREFGSIGDIDPTETIVSEAGDSLVRDTDEILDDIGDDIVDGGDPGDVVDELGPREVSNPTIVLAQNGSVATFASAFDDQGTPLSINTVVIPGNGDDRIGLTTLTDIGTTVTALDFFDPEGVDCQPCLFALAPGATQSAELQEFATDTLGSANYAIGRWLGDATLSDTGELLDALDNHHFAFSDGLSSSLPSFNLPTIAHYSLADATLPTDGAGVTGTLNTATLDIDFYEQLITDFDLAMTFGTRQVTSSLLEPVSLAHPSRLVVAARDVRLSGLCNGGSCGSQLALEGSSSLAFIGSNAEGILGSFSLNGSQQSGQSFAGAFVLGQDSTEMRPDYYNGIPAGTATPTGAVGAFASQILDGNSDDGPGGISFAAFTNPGLEIEQTLATSTINGVANVLTGFHYEPGEYEEREGELVWELAELSIDDAFLIENGSTTLGGSVPANWGIWRTPGGIDLTNSQNTELLGPYLHYAYAESVTPSTYAPEPISQLAYYSLAGGTSPTDLGDRLGTLNSVNLTLDYYQQAITAFNLSATIASANYLASLSGIEYLDGSWQDLELNLFGSCSGGDCGEGVNLSGESSLSFVGMEAQGVLGHFSLNNLGNSIGAYGVYALEESEIVAPHPFLVGTLPNVQAAPSGTYATFVSSLGSYYSTPIVSVVEQGLMEDGYLSSITEGIGLVSLGGTGNLVASINDAYSEYSNDDFHGLDITLISNSEQPALLVEAGGIADFAGTGNGVNWGRWNALATATLYRYGSVYNLSGTDHHFGFYDGQVVEAPDRSAFANPAAATYSWVGGTSPTNEYGQAGTVNLFEVDLDFFNQSVTRVDLQLSIDDRNYSASLPDLTGLYYGGIASYYATERGMPFEIIDIYGGYVPLLGSCQGGDCNNYVGYRPPQLAGTEGTPLGGAVALNLIGDNAEGLMGGYYLSADYSFDDYACGYYYGCYDVVSEGAYISAMGTAVLQRGEIEDSPYWVTSAPNDSDPIGGVSTLSYLAFDDSSILKPISMSDGTGFRTATVAGVDNVVSSVSDLSGSGCLGCSIQISDAVLIQDGEITHPFAYFENPATVSWGAWESITPGWMSGASSGDFFQFTYTEDLTQTLPDRPFSSFDDTYVYYEFAGGTSPVTGSGLHYQVEYMELDLNFSSQTIDDFDVQYWYQDSTGYSWFDLYLAYPGAVPITDGSNNIVPITLDLDGQCYNCAMDENYYTLNANGAAAVVFAGEHAEVALGSLVGWTIATDGVLGSSDFDFTIQQSFVLHQEFDDHWVINPNTESAASGGAVAAATLAMPDGALGFSFSGEIGQNGVSAGLENVVSHYNYTEPHDHPNSVATFSTDLASWAGSTGCEDTGCAWEITEGQLQNYDNNLYDSDRSFDAYWGRWMHQDDIKVDGSNYPTNGFTQFAYSPDVTEVVPDSGALTYSLITSGLAADNVGNEGYVSIANMVVDFDMQEVASFDLTAVVNSNSYVASEVDPVSLAGEPSAMIELSGTCSSSAGGSCGSSGIGISGASSITLIGPNAEGALGAFDLTSDGGGYGASGVFILEGAPVIP